MHSKKIMASYILEITSWNIYKWSNQAELAKTGNKIAHCWKGLWRRQWHPTPVLLPGKSHGWRSLVGCSPWGCEELDATEQLPFHFSLSCIGEGNGNPLQCSRLENLRDGGAWWAAVHGVTQSRTWLKWLSSSNSIIIRIYNRLSKIFLDFVKIKAGLCGLN